MLEFIIPNIILCRAIEAMASASIACAILGVIITKIGISSIGFTMSHAAFAGGAIGLFFGIPVTIAAVCASLLIAVLIGPLSDRARMSPDTTLGILFSMCMAVAIFFIAWMQTTGSGMNATMLLYGNVTSLYQHEIYGLLIVSGVAALCVSVFYKEITAIIFHRKIAEASGISTSPIFYGLLFIIAISIALSLTIIGGLLIFVWLVTPAAIASQFCRSLRSMFIVAPVVAVCISVAGAVAGLSFALPVAPLTAVIFAAVFAVAVMVSPLRRITNSKN
jgi:ABC-type Mn2+/Zn2+ transport systems, permease components